MATFEVRLRRIELPAQPEAERFIYDEWLYDFPINRKTASFAECSIDAINRKPVTVQPIDPKGHLLVQGWAVVSGENGMAAEEVFVTIMGEDGSFRVARAQIVPRSDVNAYFKHPEMGAAGVQALLDTSDLRGNPNSKSTLRGRANIFLALSRSRYAIDFKSKATCQKGSSSGVLACGTRHPK